MSAAARPIPRYSELDPQACPRLRMSEEQFVAWGDKQTLAECVDGEVILMAPARYDHVDLSTRLLSILRAFAKRRDPGAVPGSELTVRLGGRSRRMPDLLFIQGSRPDVIKPMAVEGPPDLVMEIVCPGSESRDWRDEYLEYQAAGVGEYWIIDPASQTVEAYCVGEDGRYTRITQSDGKLASTVVDGWYLKPAWLWQRPRPNVLDVLRELGVI